ncbi:hypothetical protein J4437_05915 [Candidatus Woesearchaeota archaeon]|nr:hypothetical protein [Candidatus Woesearchaeota archaeon]
MPKAKYFLFLKNRNGMNISKAKINTIIRLINHNLSNLAESDVKNRGIGYEKRNKFNKRPPIKPNIKIRDFSFSLTTLGLVFNESVLTLLALLLFEVDFFIVFLAILNLKPQISS